MSRLIFTNSLSSKKCKDSKTKREYVGIVFVYRLKNVNNYDDYNVTLVTKALKTDDDGRVNGKRFETLEISKMGVISKDVMSKFLIDETINAGEFIDDVGVSTDIEDGTCVIFILDDE